MIFEVFRQERKGQPFVHGGSFHAPDKEFADAYAREFYARRQESVALWVVPRDRARPVRHEPQLHERRAAVLRRLAVERDRVGVAAQLARGELVERPRVPDLVLGDRREGDVLLEEGGDPRPLGVAPAEDQLVVGELEQ